MSLTSRLFGAPADDLTVAIAERLAAKRVDDRIARAVQVAKPPALSATDT